MTTQPTRPTHATFPARPLGVMSEKASRPQHAKPAVRALLGAVAVCGLGASSVLAAHQVTGAPGVEILGSEDVLANHTTTAPDGELLFSGPDGLFIRMITSTDDPEISNSGDGNFHPADVDGVVAAIEALSSAFLDDLDLTVYILPFPRSGIVSSSADGNTIYICPGVYPLEDGPTLRALISHEVGHVMHNQLLPDEDEEGWDDYRELRGITDESVFHSGASHAYRPHEIFAEDFRVLFGDELAKGDGSVENPELESPDSHPGLRQFFLDLVGVSATTSSVAEIQGEADWQLYPNPAPLAGQLTIRFVDRELEDGSRPGESFENKAAFRADLYDVSGRRVTELELEERGESMWTTQLPGAGSGVLSAGVYWLRIVNGGEAEVTFPVRLVR